DVGAWYYYYPGGQCFSGGTFNAANVQVLNGVQACGALGGGNFAGGPDFANLTLPNGNVIKAGLTFWGVYGKVTYTVNDNWSFGGSVYYSDSVLNSGADGTYVAGTVKYILPSGALPNGYGAFISADVGHWYLGTSDAFYGCNTGQGCLANFPN